MPVIVFSSFDIVLLIGFIAIFRRYLKNQADLNFAAEYREKFIQLANLYFPNDNQFSRRGVIDPELYIWLTKNVNEIQANLEYIEELIISAYSDHFKYPNIQSSSIHCRNSQKAKLKIWI